MNADNTSETSATQPAAASAAALPVKDVLRSIRFGLRRGRMLLEPVVSCLPKPLNSLASQTLTNVDHVGSGVDRVLSGAAHRFLDHRLPSGIAVPVPPKPADEAGADVLFAQTVYPRLSWALQNLGADVMLISERVIADTFRSLARRGAIDGTPPTTAELLVALIDADAVRISSWRRAASVSEETEAAEARDTTALAWFSVILWTEIERDSDGESEAELLGLCCDVARALKPDVLAHRSDASYLGRLIRLHAGAI